MARILIILLTMCHIPGVMSATPTIIIDTGKTIAMPGELLPADPEEFMRAFENQQALDRQAIDDYSNIFPVATPTLQLGYVVNKQIDLPTVTPPIFLVGCDRTSIEWLRHRNSLLQEFNSVGFVIECESLTLYRQLIALFPDLTFTPVPGQELVEVFQLTHYPVVITDQGIVQ